jgi:hypothetical protein
MNAREEAKLSPAKTQSNVMSVTGPERLMESAMNALGEALSCAKHAMAQVAYQMSDAESDCQK